MATFNVISSSAHLPPTGARESPMLEFKRALDRVKGTNKPDYFELAKDIAAMASAYGGVLLLGASGGSELAEYVPLAPAAAAEACDAYETAARDRCIPSPVLTIEKIPRGQGVVVAVNIAPILDRPVAVRVKPSDAERFGSPPWAYVFPVRIGTQTISYSPENLPMLLNPQIRRIIILLECIPADKRLVTVYFAGPRRTSAEVAPVTSVPLSLDAVDIEGNAVLLERSIYIVPLDDVESVWREGEQWCLRVSGYFEVNPPKRYCTRRRA